MIDIVIVGGGTAGLSAAIYAVRAGKKVLVCEALACGGQIVVSPEVENYPGIAKTSGFEFADNLYNQAKNLGAEFTYGEISGIKDNGDKKIITVSGKEIECLAVILATGARNRLLGIEREEELTGKGVSYCATCDGAFFKGKVTAVNGGGNTALEDADFLTNYCKKVYVIHRRDSFRAEKHLVDVLKKKQNVEFIMDSNITALNGEDSLKSLTIKNNKTTEEKDLEVDGLFIAIGQAPRNEIFKNVIDIDDKGYIKAGEDCKTRTSGIFAAGDCRTKSVRQLVTAAADGAVSALGACEYINHL